VVIAGTGVIAETGVIVMTAAVANAIAASNPSDYLIFQPPCGSSVRGHFGQTLSRLSIFVRRTYLLLLKFV